MLTRVTFLAALLTLALSTAATAHEVKLGDLVIDQAWARPTIGAMKTGAAYMTIANNGTEPDQLVAVSGEVADRVELHTHLMEGGVVKMRPVDAIEVAPGAPTVLQPGGNHVMLIGLQAPLKEGDGFTLTLEFARAGKVAVEVSVGMPMGGGAGGGMQHQHGS